MKGETVPEKEALSQQQKKRKREEGQRKGGKGAVIAAAEEEKSQLSRGRESIIKDAAQKEKREEAFRLRKKEKRKRDATPAKGNRGSQKKVRSFVQEKKKLPCNFLIIIRGSGRGMRVAAAT